MKTQRRIAVVGTGAVGGYYGGLLQRAGNEVHFLMPSDHETARREGLRVDSIHGDFRLPEVHAYADAASMPACEVVIVALKTTANAQLPAILPRLLAAGGVVLLLQNGLGEEERIAGLPGVKDILGGLCFLCAHKVGPAHIRHLDVGHITMGAFAPGDRAAGITPALQEMQALFTAAGIAVMPAEDLVAARWRKLVWNMPFNGLAVLLDATTAAIMADAHSRRLARALMLETAAASAAQGRSIEEAFITRMLESTASMTPYAPSMKLDYDAGRELELESIYAEPLRRGEAHGVGMPMTRCLYDALAFMSAHRPGPARG